tara:strand:- start:610 stop:1431 length:822 start_codon:yes stop_codon:yes gene_type:complete
MNTSDSQNIYDTENYKKSFSAMQYKHFTKLFIELINEFLAHLCDKILLQNQSKYFFVLQRGIETITHIFRSLLLYTKNIELTIYHCKRAYIYYVEFIGQIGDDKNTYLQLNSKDATLFVYKKTLFEINNEYRKNFTIDNKDKTILETTNRLNKIYTQILLYILSIDKISINNRDTVVTFATRSASKIVEKLLNYDVSIDDLTEKIEIYTYFIEIMKHKNIDSIKYGNIMECFIKKLKKNEITKKQIDEKIYSSSFENVIQNCSPYKCIFWLYS